ncbi:thialysine N-epsilon-acetyltransferase-like [Diadema antillarum]|uniref:thialysine N-epsilon-acetyltransferase-like n=1 Tax=Diadema antillarum TaxID=105358 RepID=UPI003A8833AB
MASYIIRKAGPDDCEAVVPLINELAAYLRMQDEVEMTADKLRGDAFCEHPFVHILVAESSITNGTVAYTSFSYTYSSWKGRTVYLDDLYVTPKHRGAGLGTSLMQAVAKTAVAQGCTRMNWIVFAWNERPRALYTRLGGENLTEKEEWHNITLFKEQLHNFAHNHVVKVGENTKLDVRL